MSQKITARREEGAADRERRLCRASTGRPVDRRAGCFHRAVIDNLYSRADHGRQPALGLDVKDPQIKAILTQTAIVAEDELIAPLFEFRNNGRPIGNGWTSPPNGARWGTDYLSRTATAKSNMYDNAPEETRYIYTDFDKEGQRLNGANRFTVTFTAGQLPPVNGFWSLTCYNKHHLFEPNRLNRFSLGTKSKSMKQNADGSLTLHYQNESPGADRESNWVPTPKDEFSLYIRTYWPKAEILDGRWMPPPVVRVG